MKNRDEVEKSIVKIPDIIDLKRLNCLFRKKWHFLIVKVDYLFGESKANNGIDLIKEIDESKDESSLHFFLTIFSGIEDIDDQWVGNYNSESIRGSDKAPWQLAFSGMYFMPDNECWCGIYIDNIGQDIVVIGGEDFFINQLNKKIDHCHLLDVDQIIKHPRLFDFYR